MPSYPSATAPGSENDGNGADGATAQAGKTSAGDTAASNQGSDTTSSSGAADASNGAMTADEAVGVLDEQLDASLAVFDGMILDHRQGVAGMADTNAGESGTDSGGSDEPLFEEGDLGSGGDAADGTGTGGDGGIAASADNGQSTRTGANGASGPAISTASADGGVPADIADGSDDDIVARQIREAALKEQDPVLREKLWNEYRKYKNQQ